MNAEYLNNQTRWESKRVGLDQDGTAYVMIRLFNIFIQIDEENNFKYAAEYGELAKQYLIIEVFSSSAPNRPFSVIMIEFIAIAIGPKHCDFAVKDLRMQKTYGRIQFDINI